MVSSMCPGSYQTKTSYASPTRKLHIGPAKDYSTPLEVDTSVEYDLPAHIWPPKGSAPILMIHPGFEPAVPRARYRAVITPTPTAMVATSGATRPLAPLQQQQGTLTNSSSRAAIRSSRSWCSCGNPNCNSSSVKSASVQNAKNMQNVRTVQSVANITNAQSVRSVSSQDVVVINNSGINSSVILQKPHQGRSNTVIVAPPYQDRNSSVILQRPSTLTGGTSSTASTTNTTQQFVWGAGGRCRGACCNPRPAAIAPPQAEFVTPGLPPSLLAHTPTRGTAGGSPKLRAARSRRGLSVTSSVHLPDYMKMSPSRTSRVTGGTTSVHSRVPRVISSSMGGILVATPAPPMAHQNMTRASLTTSLDLARADSHTSKSLFPFQQLLGHAQLQQPSSMDLTASMGPSLAPSMVPSSMSSTASMGPGGDLTSSLLSMVVGLSHDSGCSTGVDYPLEWTSDRTRGLVDSGFCTPVNSVPDEFVTDMLSLPSWKESPASYTSVSSSGPTSSLLSGASSHHHYLPQPLWNLVY